MLRNAPTVGRGASLWIAGEAFSWVIQFFERSFEMATIQPKGERLRQAVKWISENRKEDETRPIYLLIEMAAQQFNLSPKEEEYLRAFYEQQ